MPITSSCRRSPSKSNGTAAPRAAPPCRSAPETRITVVTAAASTAAPPATTASRRGRRLPAGGVTRASVGAVVPRDGVVGCSVAGASAPASAGAGVTAADRRQYGPELGHGDLLERLPRLSRGGRPLGRRLGEQPLDPALERLRGVRRQHVERRRRMMDVRIEHRHRAAPVAEGRPAGEQLVGHDADGVDVGVRAERLAERLLGRHVRRRADRRARAREVAGERVIRAGDPEVGDLDPAAPGDEDVLRLEVAVGDRSSSACPRPLSTPSSTPNTCGSLSSRTSGRSEPPLTYSIAMNGTPPCSKKSNSVTTFGWSSAAAMRASRTKRSASVTSSLSKSSCLSATSRSSAGWRAR